jgi:hypothetical protein
VDILPQSIKQQYQNTYESFLSQLSEIAIEHDYNASDPNNYQMVIKEQAKMCLHALNTETPDDSDQQLEILVRHCERWDRVYGYDARKLYPEFDEILDRYNYGISS